MEGDLARPATELDRARPGAGETPVLEPAMTLAGLDGENILDLARNDLKALDADQRLFHGGGDRCEFDLLPLGHPQDQCRTAHIERLAQLERQARPDFEQDPPGPHR
jgi:hypothetical protein